MIRIMPMAALAVLSCIEPALAVSDTCQAAWERAERIRVELGLRPGSRIAPMDKLRPEEACLAALTIPEDDLRAAIQESIKICGGDCRDLRQGEKR